MKVTIENLGEVSVYPVGILEDLIRTAQHIRYWSVVGGNPLRHLRRSARYLGQQARRRNWRAARSAFNGYLAEPLHWPDSGLRGCGHGWTKRRAVDHLIDRFETERDPEMRPLD